MKRIACFILCIAALLTLCACGAKESAGNPATVPAVTPNTTPATTVDTTPETTANAPEKEPEKPAFEPVAVYDDAEYCTVQLDGIQPIVVNDTLCEIARFTATNHSDSTIRCDVGKSVYVNDVLASPETLREVNAVSVFIDGEGFANFTDHVELAPEQTEIFYRIVPVTSADEVTMDFAIKILWDNGEIGAYYKEVELMNGLFRACVTETAASDKYIASGDEPFALKTDNYKMIVTSCGENQDLYREKYWFQLYLENTTEVDLTFKMVKTVGNMANVTSDQQDRRYYVTVWLNCNYEQVTLAPGKGFYMLAQMPKSDIDGAAKDASEVITLHVPFMIYDGDDKWTSTWQESQEVQLIRDTFANGFRDVKPTAEPPETATEPAVAPTTEPAAAPTTEPAAEPTTEPTEDFWDLVAPGDPGDIGSGGVPDIPGGPIH